MSTKNPNPIDVHVGMQIKLRRKILSISQSALGDQLGITFQQVQKYEKGTNRVGASRLQAIAKILGVDAAFFFQSAPGAASPPQGQQKNEASELQTFLTSQDGFALNQAFFKIKDQNIRRQVVALVKAFAEAEEGFGKAAATAGDAKHP
ncbi:MULTISPECIES: helix-turn-helix domain-containing protein [Ciceribacter]|nr:MULTISPECIES: helix-turn-helix transcriptional regulator [unclassified Ciceribacter]